ncbi:PHB depolymerase family esterase [Exercitatus varius]|uniref:PHB depolymerase family esterase n=1 Tax=Exercitatus varius TaxID=67857 RepID=UPI00294AEDF6|nr:PHB depolymerase family esterase [Exercitatus varius]MDG2941737.1 PHB depolymerase family esterase [Exercitatus varius]
MQTRREFLLTAAGAALIVGAPVLARAADIRNMPSQATAITQVFGDGVKLIAVALEYPDVISTSILNTGDFSVTGRTVSQVFTAQSIGLTPADSGKFVIVRLVETDADTSLQEDVYEGDPEEAKPQIQGGKPNWVAGQKMKKTIRFKEASADVSVKGKMLSTSATRNLIADSFRQAEFADEETGKTLKYNLFIPDNTNQTLPLVLFMHDAGVTSEQTKATLYQGLGAIIWADPAEQTKRPCYVLAPQYDEIIADDDWRTSKYLETTIHLIQKLIREHKIDPKRIYATGQSGGCMTAIAMNIKYPKFFAASYLVAGKWNPDIVIPMAKNKVWWMASEDDLGAFPSFNAITEQLAKQGTKINRAVWNGKWNADQYRFAYDDLTSTHAQMYYTVFVKDSVFRETDSRQGASGHRNTWRIAYTIEPIREWLFEQTTN